MNTTVQHHHINVTLSSLSAASAVQTFYRHVDFSKTFPVDSTVLSFSFFQDIHYNALWLSTKKMLGVSLYYSTTFYRYLTIIKDSIASLSGPLEFSPVYMLTLQTLYFRHTQEFIYSIIC